MEINTGTEVQSPLEALVETLTYESKLKQDYVVPAGHVRYDALTGLLQLGNDVDKRYKLTDHAHDQVSAKLEIPRAYYDKMRRSYPELLAQNINGWLSRKENVKYLLRTFNYGDENIQKVCRAMLSDRYCILDNFDVLTAALEAIKGTGIHIEVVKAEVTEKRMYLHVVAPEIHIEATELLDKYLADREHAVLNNGIISGLVICNSEVGLSRFEVSARAQILRCKNGLHDRNASFKRTHLGARMDEGFVEWSSETKQKNYNLIISQVKDAVKTYLSTDYLGKLTTKLLKYKEHTIEHPAQVIEQVSNTLMVPTSHREQILKHFLRSGDESTFGMMNAFTMEAQKMTPDLQYEVESSVFELLPNIHKFDKPASKN